MSIENPNAIGDSAGNPNNDGTITAVSEGELLQLVSFVVGDEEFAVPILSVQEINRMMQITRVPQSPEYVEGVINLRGKIIPVIDLRKRFSMGELKDSSDARIIVVEVANRVIGFTVDRVNEVLRISSDIVDPPPSICSSISTDYIQGVGKLNDRLLIMLNLEKLFADYDMDELEQVTKNAA
ncbi:chemotaxis protein CheW [Planctomycetota bacterium]|nr:chemotaxis protein CheW [Planctomycetota bacterium]